MRIHSMREAAKGSGRPASIVTTAFMTDNDSRAQAPPNEVHRNGPAQRRGLPAWRAKSQLMRT